MTGIGGWIESSSVGPVLGGVCEFIAAPTSAVILVVIGYRMNFIGVAWKKISKVIVLRPGATGNHGSTCICILQDIRGIFAEPLTLISVIVMLILPPPFIVPLYVEGEEKKNSTHRRFRYTRWYQL